MRASIFLGPSIPLENARKLLPAAIFHPPAEQGDLLTAVDQDGTEILGLIDGTFHQNLSVWHNEVCYLLSKGVTIYGSSSMGALRAVETERFGMIGVGRVYQWYRDGVINGDDEVALLHGDAHSHFRPLSEPLVNIRASLERAVSDRALEQTTANIVIRATHSLYYPNRLVTAILQRSSELGLEATQLRAAELALTTGYADIKRMDAQELLITIARVLDGSVHRPNPVAFKFARSAVFETLYNLDRKVRGGDGMVRLQNIAEHVALHCAEFKDVRRAALDRSVVLLFAMLVGIRATQDEVEEERKAFCVERGLDSPEKLNEWLRGNAFSEADLSEYLLQEALCHRMRRWVVTARGLDRGCKVLLDELRMRGLFPCWAKHASQENAIIANYWDEPEYHSIRNEDPRLLAERHAANGGVHVRGDASMWAEEAGFEDVGELAEALRRAVVAEDVRNRIVRQLRVFEDMLLSLSDDDNTNPGSS